MRDAQPVGTEARGLSISDQTVHNWVKAEADALLVATTMKPVTAEQLEIALLKAELARVRMDREILKKRRRVSRSSRCDLCHHRATQECLADHRTMPGAGRQR